jgi:hypothetical protein
MNVPVEAKKVMDSDPVHPQPESRSPAAERMRLHRKRRREGTHYVRIPLASFEIEGLIRLKVLPKAHREDADALQAAVLTIVYQALDGAG